MSKIIFKPRNFKTYVPGHGVIDKADFTDVHYNACVKQVQAAKLDVDEYLKKHFEVASYADLPLFEDDSQAEAEEVAKKAAEQKAKDDAAEAERIAAEEAAEKLRKEQEEAELLRLMEEEEAAKKAGNNTGV